MDEYLTLGSTPYDESCAQVGSEDYYPKMRKEAKAYINQLRRMFPDEELRFSNKGFPHDYGTYHEVIVRGPRDKCFEVDNNLPANWDEEALKELKNEH